MPNDSKSEKPLIDFTLGDALFPFDDVADYALNRAAENQNQYICNNPDAVSMSQPLLDVLDKMAPWLVKKGFLDETEKDRIAYRSIISGGGASEGFEHILRMLMLDISKQRKTGQKITPVIVVPTPTYGFFLTMMKQWGIQVASTKRNMKNGGALDIDKLKAGLEKLDKKGFRVIAYFDSNPHNPTGLVRGEKETREIADLIEAMNKRYKKRDKTEGHKWDGPASRIRIIDDLVYTGTEYEDVAPAYSFMKIPKCRDNTFLLLGLSKIGLAGLRAGYLLAPEDDSKVLRTIQQNGSYFASRAAIYGIEAFFNLEEPFNTQRETHMRKLNNAHERNGHLMKAIANGLNSMDELSDTQKQDLTSHIASLRKISNEEAENFLNRPIEYVKIITTPQAGFFHIMDMSAIFDKNYCILDTPEKKEYAKLNDERLVKAYIDYQKIFLLSSRWMGYDKGSAMLFRMTYAMPENMIIDGMERIREFVGTLQ